MIIVVSTINTIILFYYFKFLFIILIYFISGIKLFLSQPTSSTFLSDPLPYLKRGGEEQSEQLCGA